MSDTPLLSLVVFLPLLGVLLIALLARGDEAVSGLRARRIALVVSLANFALSLLVLKAFDPSNTAFQLVETIAWMPKYQMAYHLGIDGISIWFIILSAFLTPICVLSAASGVTKRAKEFMIALLVLETTMIGMFAALDLVLFYLFFEASLIPMFLMIGVWGGPGKVQAAFRFFLYTFIGSVLMLVALITVASMMGTTDMVEIIRNAKFPMQTAEWLWLAFFVAFAVKSPMWPMHTWLPYAHVEAPTIGSVMLAGVLLKMGGYGLIRICVQMLPEASAYFAPLVFALSIVAIIYTSLVALVQSDMKKLIAYSSVAHMGYVTLGIFTMNTQGLEGAMYVMLSHGVVSAALFLGVGVVYDRLHTREIARYGGLANNMPHYAFAFMIFTLAAVGLPGTSGFIGEFLSMQGAFLVNSWVAFFAATGVILGAAYMLLLYRRVFYGPSVNADAAAMKDLTWQEYAMFIPMIAFVLWMGIYPNGIRNVIAPSVATIVTDAQAHIIKGDQP